MIPGLAEYVSLRLLRRFLFTDAFLVRFGKFVPYYRTNANQLDAGPVVDLYADAMARSGLPLAANRSILEIGSGATNSVGYALLRRQLAGAKGRIYLFEPRARLDRRADANLRKRFGNDDLARVERIATLAVLPDRSIDLVLSHSVLEHVADMDGLLASLERVLQPAGSMIHSVDYRDHFFKYPYHFLLFRQKRWERWLNPGDLPRWRLSGHLEAFSAHGFCAEVQDRHCLSDAFDRIKTSISRDFDRDDPALAVATAIILNSRRGDASSAQRDAGAVPANNPPLRP